MAHRYDSERSRPNLSGPSPPHFKEGMLTWEWIDARMNSALNYWLASATVEGRPHAVPIWGAWLDDRFYFVGGGRKVRNLRANPRAIVHLESGNEVVLIEGRCKEESSPSQAMLQQLDNEFLSKYPGFRPSEQLQHNVDAGNSSAGLFVVHPLTVTAWSGFAGNATPGAFRLSRRSRFP